MESNEGQWRGNGGVRGSMWIAVWGSSVLGVQAFKHSIYIHMIASFSQILDSDIRSPSLTPPFTPYIPSSIPLIQTLIIHILTVGFADGYKVREDVHGRFDHPRDKGERGCHGE